MDKDRLQDVALLLLRIALGVVMAFYGAQKMFGVFGGAGFAGTLEMFQKGMGIPGWAGACAIFAEFFGGLGVLFGALSRVAAGGIAATMGVAFVINLSKTESLTRQGMNDPFRDVAYPGTFLLVSVAVLLLGPGRFALDTLLFGRRKGKG